MDRDEWWEELKRVIRETRENMSKIDTRNSKDEVFYEKNRIEDFQNSERLRKLREYDRDLREMLMKSSEQSIISLNQPITPRVTRRNNYENELLDYIFKHISQGISERNIITGLLADIKGDLKSIIKFNKNEKKRLDDLETEEFIKSQESKLIKGSMNIGKDNEVDDLEAIKGSLKMVADKLSTVETQNEDVLRKLDKICKSGDQKLSDQRMLLDELQRIAKTLTSLIDESNSAHQDNHVKISKELKKLCDPVHPSPVKVKPSHYGNDYSTLEAWNLPGEFKTRQQLLWEYEENRRQLKLLEEEGFQSPDFLRKDFLSPFLTSDSQGRDPTRITSKRTRFSDQEHSTDADLTIEDLS